MYNFIPKNITKQVNIMKTYCGTAGSSKCIHSKPLITPKIGYLGFKPEKSKLKLTSVPGIRKNLQTPRSSIFIAFLQTRKAKLSRQSFVQTSWFSDVGFFVIPTDELRSWKSAYGTAQILGKR
jgi:hypothetical protein